MRRTLMTLCMSLAIFIAQAQKSDTTQTETPQKPMVSESPQKEQPAQQEEPAKAEDSQQQVIKEESATSDNQPRIIYYQSSDKQNPPYESSRRYSSRYSSRYDKRSDIKTLAGGMNHSGGFGALSFRMTDFENETMVMAGLRAGWIINRTLGIGFEGHGIIPTTQLSGIDPIQNVVAIGGYGGMFLELILFSNQVVHLTFPASAGAGWIGYTDDWENANSTGMNGLIDEDIFWYLEPGANVEINISRNFRLAVGMSQRFTQDMELLNTSAKALEKRNYYVTLKIGGF